MCVGSLNKLVDIGPDTMVHGLTERTNPFARASNKILVSGRPEW